MEGWDEQLFFPVLGILINCDVLHHLHSWRHFEGTLQFLFWEWSDLGRRCWMEGLGWPGCRFLTRDRTCCLRKYRCSSQCSSMDHRWKVLKYLLKLFSVKKVHLCSYGRRHTAPPLWKWAQPSLDLLRNLCSSPQVPFLLSFQRLVVCRRRSHMMTSRSNGKVQVLELQIMLSSNIFHICHGRHGLRPCKFFWPV